jgi:hypothetical protein
VAYRLTLALRRGCSVSPVLLISPARTLAPADLLPCLEEVEDPLGKKCGGVRVVRRQGAIGEIVLIAGIKEQLCVLGLINEFTGGVAPALGDRGELNTVSWVFVVFETALGGPVAGWAARLSWRGGFPRSGRQRS